MSMGHCQGKQGCSETYTAGLFIFAGEIRAAEDLAHLPGETGGRTADFCDPQVTG